MNDPASRQSIYKADSIRLKVPGYRPSSQRVPYGTNVDGVLFDGYPQIVRDEESQPKHGVKVEKDIMVPMRDGVHLCTDVYRPDVPGERFPALLAFAYWAKDVQEAIGWLAETPQPYYDSPFWDGCMEACNFNYTVPRGYAHIIPDPRGVGNSEGYGTKPWFDPHDCYDMIEWIAAQPWCDGRVGMIGPSAYSIMQIHVATLNPPHLVALRADECGCGNWDYFNGLIDILAPYSIEMGGHANDGATPTPNYDYSPLAPRMLAHPDLEKRVAEALENPDFKYNSKWYSYLKYPRKYPLFFDLLLASLHPEPYSPPHSFVNEKDVDKIKLPIYLGTPWDTRIYIYATFDLWRTISTRSEDKKLILYPPGFPDRPYVEYHDEMIRWSDHWLKGIDTGIMDEPPIKMFVMGINKWRFENDWPLARTEWTRLYLRPGGGLSPETAPSGAEPDTLCQPAPYLDPTVYCLSYSTGPLAEDTEITGPIALNLFASIDTDDTNWFADLVDVDPDGNRQLISSGGLKAAHRAVDEQRSTPYYPIHPWAEPVPVPQGEIIEYNVAMMPASCVFQKGHSIELIVRNQEDLLSRLALWGVHHMPLMRTVTHNIHFGKSHLLLPVIPGTGSDPGGARLEQWELVEKGLR
jgi:predicted acyl esterase